MKCKVSTHSISFQESCVHSSIQSFREATLSFVHWFIYSVIQSVSQSFTHSLRLSHSSCIHSVTQSFSIDSLMDRWLDGEVGENGSMAGWKMMKIGFIKDGNLPKHHRTSKQPAAFCLPPVRTVNSFQLRDLGVHYEIGWSHQPNLWPRSRTALHSSPIWFGCEYVEHHALLVHAGEKDAGFKRFHRVGWFHCELMCITFRLK